MKTKRRRRTKASRRHPDRNAGGGDHHRAVRGAGGAQHVQERRQSQRVTAARAQINNFKTALGTYKLDTGTFPTTEQGLEALRVPSRRTSTQWDGPYLPKEIPNDPWGIPTSTSFPATTATSRTSSRYGADGQPGGEGINADIVSWKNN